VRPHVRPHVGSALHPARTLAPPGLLLPVASAGGMSTAAGDGDSGGGGLGILIAVPAEVKDDSARFGLEWGFDTQSARYD